MLVGWTFAALGFGLWRFAGVDSHGKARQFAGAAMMLTGALLVLWSAHG